MNLQQAAARLAVLTDDARTVREALNRGDYLDASLILRPKLGGCATCFGDAARGYLAAIIAAETPLILRRLEERLAVEIQAKARDTVGRYVTAMQAAGADPMTGEIRKP